MGWKDELDRKFLDTIRQLKLQKAGLEQQLIAKPDDLPAVALLKPLPGDWDQPRKKSIWGRLSDSFESFVG